jgi:hypothetical protein
MEMENRLEQTRTDARLEVTRRMLLLLDERLGEANRAGDAALKLEPGDLRRLGSEAGVEGDAVDAFRALVKSNLVRLRGRWREGVSGVRTPVYVARLTGPHRRGRKIPAGRE